MSTLRSALRNAPRRAATDETGLTIIELVVAMSIFTIVLAIYFGALMSMSNTTVRAQDNVDASDALRQTFNALDHQVRYATSINRPGQGGSGAWYVEMEATDLPQGAPKMCYQWRLDPATDVLSTRTMSGTSTASDWRGVAWDVKSGNVSGGVAVSPFQFTAAGGTIVRQSLTVHLRVDSRTATTLADQATTFIARNSSADPLKSPSNADADHNGVSDNPVCTAGMSRS